MIQATITSKKSGRVIKKSYTARQLLDFHGEDDLAFDMTECDCQPIGETYVVDCNCDEEWYEYTLILEQHS